MKARRVAAGLAAALTLASLTACGGDESPQAGPSPSKNAPEPLPYTLSGSVTVNLGGFVWDKGQGCWGYGEHSEITGGADVVVRDAAGTVIAQGTLDTPGVVQMQMDDETRAESCTYTFKLPDVPRGKKFYSVQIADVEPKQLTEAEIGQHQDWTVN